MNPQVASAQVVRLTQELKMPGLRTQFAEIAREAGGTQGSFEAFLAACLRAEVESRREHRLKERLKQARFLHKRTLEDFDFSLAPSLSQALVLSLAGGEFVKQKENVILPPAFRSYSSNCLHLNEKSLHMAFRVGQKRWLP